MLTPKELTIEQLDECSTEYRRNVSLCEKLGTYIRETQDQLTVLLAVIKHNEENAVDRGSTSRDSHRSGVGTELDGSRDSPVPSPAENRHIRKIGGGRNSSQPPRIKETQRSENAEASEAAPSRTKITFKEDDEVAFKPKATPPEETDWIQGIVVQVIGEGKSRRYKVQDPFPDEGKPSKEFMTSASSMAPIPPPGTLLGPYEVGKRVLALYPETTTFYRATVKTMLEDGNKVKLLFDGDEDGVHKEVERRFVLDHKG